MKIKTKVKTYEEVMALKPQKHKKPLKQSLLFRTLLRVVSIPDLAATKFSLNKIGMERLGKKEPAFVLMNHSSFIDLKIASTVLFPRPFNIVCTTDGFVGKNWLMRLLGCIPTNKFVFDLNLVRDMKHAVNKLNSSILMYPEAGYSFDGRATTLADSIGQCVKMLGVPLVMIKTYGAFARDPLYNNLQRRRVKVSADMIYLLSPEEIKEKSAEEITALVNEQFAFDSFRWQQENRIPITESFRADSLNRLLYKCPACHTEGKMEGRGTDLVCHQCHKRYHLDEYGYIKALDGVTEFEHIPDWFDWERECVRAELENGTYKLDTEVEIRMLVDSKCLYQVGDGRLTHTQEGFHLVGCDGKLDYVQKPTYAHSLNSDFYWYEIGDVIGLGNQNALYYCFPKNAGDIVTKARFATEELYKLTRPKRSARKVTTP